MRLQVRLTSDLIGRFGMGILKYEFSSDYSGVLVVYLDD